MKRWVVSLMFLVFFLFFFTIGSNAATVEVRMVEYDFVPDIVNINVGDTVRWINDGLLPHTSTSGTVSGTPLSCNADGLWNSDIRLPAGEPYEQVFDTPGTFPYYCQFEFHCLPPLNMTGTVIVTQVPPPEVPVSILFSGPVTLSVKVTTLTQGPSGLSFGTATQSFSGTMEFILKDENTLVPGNGGCLASFTGDPNMSICIQNLSSLPTQKTRGADSILVVGTGFFTRNTAEGVVTGPAYLDAKGTIKKDAAGAITSIAFTGKLGGGEDLGLTFAVANFRTTVLRAIEGALIVTPLSGAQIVPDPVITPAVGTGLLVVDLSSGNARGNMTFSGLSSNATVAHIHQQPADTTPGLANGPVIVNFAGGAGGTTGVWMIPPDPATVLNADQLAALSAGRLYFQIHSVNFPPGELRGQIGIFRTTTPVTGAQNVPPVTTTATGTGNLAVNTITRSITGNLTFSGLSSNSVAAHIHQGAAGAQVASSPIIITLEGGDGVVSGTYNVPAGTALTQDQLNAFLTGGLYFAIHSVNNPGGELRGQILPLN